VNDRPMSVLKNQLGGIDQHRRLLVAIGVFVVMLVFLSIVSEGSLSYFGINILSTNTGALVFAAMGQTIVFLLGGFDLSAGATLSLVNIIVAQNTGDSTLSQVLMVFVGIGVGAAVGAFNGFFIAFMRLQPVVVTLASMFIILGLNLLLMPNPGGYIPNEFSYFFTGESLMVFRRRSYGYYWRWLFGRSSSARALAPPFTPSVAQKKPPTRTAFPSHGPSSSATCCLAVSTVAGVCF